MPPRKIPSKQRREDRIQAVNNVEGDSRNRAVESLRASSFNQFCDAVANMTIAIGMMSILVLFDLTVERIPSLVARFAGAAFGVVYYIRKRRGGATGSALGASVLLSVLGVVGLIIEAQVLGT